MKLNKSQLIQLIKEALKEQAWPETGEPKQEFQDLVSDVDDAIGKLIFFGKRNYKNGLGWKAIRLSKSLRKVIDNVRLTEGLSTRSARNSQDIEDSFDLAYDYPISKQEKDWEIEQDNLDTKDVATLEDNEWEKKMEKKYGPDWEQILQNAEIDRMLLKTQR